MNHRSLLQKSPTKKTIGWCLDPSIHVTNEWVMAHTSVKTVYKSRHVYLYVYRDCVHGTYIYMSWKIVCMAYGALFAKELYHIWMSHVACEWVMSHTNESCHIRMRHVTYAWVVSYMNESWHIYLYKKMSRRGTRHMERRLLWVITYEWVMSHMNGSCHIWMGHVTYEWVMSHMNESCHIWMSHVTYIYIKEGYQAYGASLAITPVVPAESLHLEPPEPGSYLRHDSFICVTWLIRMCTPWTSRDNIIFMCNICIVFYTRRFIFISCWICFMFWENSRQFWVMRPS